MRALLERMFGARQRKARLAYWRSVKTRSLMPLLLAVFFLFAVQGFLTDLLNFGKQPIPIAITWALFSGTVAAAYLLSMARRPRSMPFVVAAQILLTLAVATGTNYLMNHHLVQNVKPEAGVRFAAISIMIAVTVSYSLFLVFASSAGVESVRVATELAAAHDIQRRLVPDVSFACDRFEAYGHSRPSDKVGGDLVSVVERDGVFFAYVADVSGHGLPSSLMMSMLTAGFRTALLGAPRLPLVLTKVNSVLPEVKQPNMYTTFAGARFSDGRTIELALGGHPPILHWKKGLDRVEEQGQPQLPLGLLPEAQFSSVEITTEPGDILMIITDGLLEAANEQGEEFGLGRLKETLKTVSTLPLDQAARDILQTVDAFGKQNDDQSLLLLRLH